MTREHLTYLAERFLTEHRMIAAEKRLVFDAWADRQRFTPRAKRRLWREVKTLSRR